MLHEGRGDSETSRSGLFHEAIRIIKEMRDCDRLEQLRSGRSDINVRPRYAIYENVPGAFSSNGGDDFRVVLEEVARVCEAGVIIPRPEKGKWKNTGVIIGDNYSIAWRVFDAQHWGVPQRRKRICLVADFNGHTAPEIVFNEVEHNGCSVSSYAESSVRDSRDESRSQVQSVSEGLSRNPEQSGETREEVTSYAEGSTGASHPAYTYQDREGCDGGGKGFLIQEDMATSLRTNNYMTVFQPTVALEGNGQRPSHQGDGYSETDKSYTLNSTEVHGVAYAVDMGGGKSACDILDGKSPTLCTTHYGEPAVVYDARGNGDGNTAPTMTGDHENRITDYTGVVVSMDRASFNQGQNAQFDFQIDENGVNSTLVAKGPGAVCYVEGIDLYNQTSTGDVSKCLNSASSDADHIPCVINATHGNFFMNPFVNVSGTLQATDYKEPPMVCYPNIQEKTVSLMASGYDKQGTQEAANGMYVVGQYWDGTQTAGTLTAHNANGSQRMPDKDNCNLVIQRGIRYIVRRLTPLECERLQGFPDGWTDIGEYVDSNGKQKKVVDSARYKALGNSIALPSWRWVLKRMSANYERTPTMASLFDGIGGFPLIWEGINGKGTCLWASEIEEFPMAVTKERFK